MRFNTIEGSISVLCFFSSGFWGGRGGFFFQTSPKIQIKVPKDWTNKLIGVIFCSPRIGVFFGTSKSLNDCGVNLFKETAGQNTYRQGVSSSVNGS